MSRLPCVDPFPVLHSPQSKEERSPHETSVPEGNIIIRNLVKNFKPPLPPAKQGQLCSDITFCVLMSDTDTS